ncbi:MAG TPA: amidohydrolase family protein [Vicinamibacteria bacterium]|nr:amidohydrolase family protein [Vicinamibacteria bacterium]
MRIDSHQHFWHYDPAQHVWMTEAMGALRRDYLPDDLAPLLQAAGFDGTVAVQARQTLEETTWLLALADRHSWIRGVVGWVDLCSDELPAQLERLAPQKKLVGVRHVVHDEPDDGFMLRPEFRRGVARLGEFELAYDLLLFPRHLEAAVRLVDEFEDQLFVLDHIAKPPIRGGVLSPWKEDLERLAERPNVFCKLSGMVTEARWSEWRREDFRPYLDAVLEAFSPQRLMIGSDWPVCTLSADYSSTMGLVASWLEALAPDACAGILGDNCARFYGLPRHREGR